jgi:hypothetical protein
MKAPAGGLISLFSHKVHSFFGELGASATSHNAYTFNRRKVTVALTIVLIPPNMLRKASSDTDAKAKPTGGG